MNKYLVRANNKTDEYATLFEAYSSVDYDAVFLSLKEYIELKFTNMMSCDDFIDVVKSLQNFSNIISSQVQAKYNVQDINQVFVLTTGSNDNATAKNIIVLENEYFMSRFNALLKDLGYDAVIEKNNDFIIQSIESYLLNHTNELLDIASNIVIKYNTNFCKPWTISQILNVDNYTFADTYNSEDKYRAVMNMTIYSANEYTVLQDFVAHISEIVNLIISYKDELKGSLSHRLLQLLY